MNLAERKARAAHVVASLKKLIPESRIALNFGNAWELVVATELAAQCTDKKVNEVTAKLFKKYQSLDDYVHADPRAFEADIHATGFYRAKTKNILAAARMVRDEFGGMVPRTMAEITRLPGVGRKTGNVVLANAYHVAEGIAVDTHVRRLAKVLGLTDHTDPDRIEQDLLAVIPRDEWKDFNHRLVEYGKRYCPARAHRHDLCPPLS